MALKVFGIFSDINRTFSKSLPKHGSYYRHHKHPVDRTMDDYLKGAGEFSAVSEVIFEERLKKKMEVKCRK